MKNDNEFVINIPSKLNTKETINFSKFIYSISRNIRYKKYIIDFSNTTKAFPFGVLFIAKLLKHLINAIEQKDKNTCIVFRYKEGRNHIESYLQHIGFFKYIGANLGRNPGEAFGSHTYMPIKILSKRHILSSASEHNKHIGEIIVRESESIADIVTSSFTNLTDENLDFLKMAISYSCREIIRNSIEHSADEEVIIFVQSFLSLKQVEIAIMDNGVGFLSTLYPKYELYSGVSAIETALLPGVSGTDTSVKTNDDWQNSGFGLYVISELCKEINNSTLYIASSDATYSISKNNIISRERNLWTPGTTTMLSIGTNNDCYFSNILEKIVRRGESIACASNGIATASKMSKTV